MLLTDRQTNQCRQKHNLCGRGNEVSMVVITPLSHKSQFPRHQKWNKNQTFFSFFNNLVLQKKEY